MNASIRTKVWAAGLAAWAGVAGAMPAWAGSGGSDQPRVALLELEDAVPDRPGAMDWLMGAKAEASLRELVESIEAAAEDDELDAMLIRLKDPMLTTTQIEELGEALTKFRAAGKKIHLVSDAFGTSELLLGSYADEIIAQSGTPVMLPGVYMEEMFLADTLNWIGVKADYVQVGDYKGASEMMARNGPSPEWDQNINQLLDSMYANVRTRLKAGRNMDDAKLDAAMASAWLSDAEEAKGVGLIDSTIDLPDLSGHLSGKLGGEIAWASPIHAHEQAAGPDMSNPFAIFGMFSQKPSHEPTRDTIAVLHISGPIIDGESSASGLFGGEESSGSRTLRRAMEEIADEDLIKGVVVRIDSPGGSATASEVIWQGLRRLAEEKPVWVSVGSMAASGGYYCAVAGDKIYVNPSSIVGSIGVVGGRLSMGDLYKEVKVNVVSRSRGPMAGMFRSTSPWTDAERVQVRAKMQRVYDQFTSRVKAGREGIDLSKTAEGRLFTGDKAIALNMADKIGGLDTAIGDLAASLSLEDHDVMHYPAPKSLQEILEEAFSGFGASAPATASPLARAGRELLGDRAWSQLSGQLRAFMELRNEPVLLVSPRAIIFGK